MIKKEYDLLFRNRATKLAAVLLSLLVLVNIFNSFSSKAYDEIFEKYGSKNINLLLESNYTNEIGLQEGGIYFLEQVSYIDQYYDRLGASISEVKDKMESSLFSSDKDQKELSKSLVFYEEKYMDTIKLENSGKVDIVANRNYHKIVVLMIAFIIASVLFFKDFENGNISLYKTTEYGIVRLYWTKLLVFISVLAGVVLILLITDVLILRDFKYSINSLESLSGVKGNYTIHQFLGLKYVILMIITTLLSLFYLMLLLVTRHRPTAIVILVSLVFVEMLLFFLIAPNSSSEIFKYINIYYLGFFYNGQFSLYSYLTIMLSIMGLLFLPIVNLFLYSTLTSNRKRIKSLLQVNSSSWFLQFFYQVFVTSGGLLLILLIVLYSYNNYSKFSVTSKSKESAYQDFKTLYLGPIDNNFMVSLGNQVSEMEEVNEKVRILEQEIEDFPEKALSIYAENDELFQISNGSEYLDRLVFEVESLRTQGIHTLVDDRGANLLLMTNQPIFLMQNISVLLGGMLIVGYFSERNNYTYKNIEYVKSSLMGLKKYKQNQSLILLVLSVLSGIILKGFHSAKILKNFSINFTNTLGELLISNSSVKLSNAILMISICAFTAAFITSLIGKWIYRLFHIRE